MKTRLIAPLMAPLSHPMIVHLASADKRAHALMATTLDEQLSAATQQFRTFWSQLTEQVEEKRERVYALMTPVVQQQVLSTDWVIEALTDAMPRKPTHQGKPLTAQTMSRWREQGVLRYQQKNQPDADNAAALLTARMIDPRERGWLPSMIAAEEPLWWCWRQDSPAHPIVPCPVPLPEDLPAAALLWTRWRGAAWQPTWLPLGTLGAARWAGTMKEQGTLLWSLTEQELEAWDAEIVPLGRGVLDTAARLTRHTLATLALLRLATPRLEQQAVPQNALLSSFDPTAP